MATLWLGTNSELATALVVGRPDVPVIEGVVAQIWIEGADGLPQILGYCAPGETLKVPYNPVQDGDVTLRLKTLTQDGGAEAISLADADVAVVSVNRETVAPTITQSGAATNTKVTVGVAGFSRYARKRKVEVSNNSDMSSATITEYNSSDYVTRGLPDFIDITRSAAPAAATKYVRVSHASGDTYGPVSNILTITFTDSGGGGGSSPGDFTPGGRDGIILS